ncbi:MAG: hypothetical protein E7672_02495 [Ruminococcaceae bacterium]|nr:hypothetical protein [Oscillospiraceae bacterium]
MNNTTSQNNVTVELLSEMYRNVTMGSENLASVVPMIKNKNLLTNVTAQMEKYEDFTKRTEKLMNARAVKPKEPSLMKIIMSRGGIAINTALDSSDGHIAEMIVKGTKTGVKDLESTFEQMKKRGVDSDAAELCGEIIGFERHEIDRAKDFI